MIVDPGYEKMVAVWPLALYFALAVVIAAAMMIISWLMGSRHRERATGEPYESGMLPTGSARLRFAADYYLVAMFFVIFDLEAAFIYVWAISLKQAGWTGYTEMAVFIGVLLASLIYLWRVGALEWGTSGQGRRRQQPERSERDHAAQ